MSKMSNLMIMLEEVKEEICDEYCKWPFNTEDQAELNVYCAKCPLNRITEDEDEHIQ